MPGVEKSAPSVPGTGLVSASLLMSGCNLSALWTSVQLVSGVSQCEWPWEVAELMASAKTLKVPSDGS